jgi:hypothetical protein
MKYSKFFINSFPYTPKKNEAASQIKFIDAHIFSTIVDSDVYHFSNKIALRINEIFRNEKSNITIDI